MRNNKEFISDDDLMNSDNLVEEGDFVATTKGMLIKYKGSDKNLIIPSEVKGVKITMLGNASDFFLFFHLIIIIFILSILLRRKALRK